MIGKAAEAPVLTLQHRKLIELYTFKSLLQSRVA